MFGAKKETGLPKKAHRKIEVETIDNCNEFGFEEGGIEVSVGYEAEFAVVTKSDGLKAAFPLMNVIRVEEYSEEV